MPSEKSRSEQSEDMSHQATKRKRSSNRDDQSDTEKPDKEAVWAKIESLMSKGTVRSRLMASTVKPRPFFPVCPRVTYQECLEDRQSKKGEKEKLSLRECSKIHLQPLIRGHTQPSLGHCSYLNTCYGEPSYAASPSLGGPNTNRSQKDCRYLHFEIGPPPESLSPSSFRTTSVSSIKSRGPNRAATLHGPLKPAVPNLAKIVRGLDDDESVIRYPASWISCDVRKFDLEVLGKFDVIMADPPWDIHMSLPYGTMTDDEMRSMPIPHLQDNGLCFLWVTARAMELGRDLLTFWGYRRVDEIVWAKTNQIGRLIRTGRTGHWLNHTCEHLLIGIKSPADPSTPNIPNTTWPDWLQRGLDTDVLVSEVRETSRKPDEVYDLIERCCRGGRKLEIFGRKHNTRPGWLTIGNQIGGDCVYEPALAERLKQRYPERKNLVLVPV